MNIPISKIVENKGQIKGLPANPRLIKDARFEALKKSIEDAPEMLELRELLVYPYEGKFVVIGGNMRLKACKALGYGELPCKVIKADTSVEKLREYTIKDNIGFGENDWESLANEWDEGELEDWGLELPITIEEEEEEEKGDVYTNKVTSPIYEPKNRCPNIVELCDTLKVRELIEEIETSNVSEEEKEFLIEAAHRHAQINYARVADYYAYASGEMKELMEKSALVIIDFDKSIELGFTRLQEGIREQYEKAKKEDEGDDEE